MVCTVCNLLPCVCLEPSNKQMTSRERSNANLRPEWKPGESGNPLGRPPKDVSITSHIKRLLEQEGEKGRTNAELIAQALIDIAKDSLNTKGKASIVKEVLDRVEGKVKDTLLVEGGSVSINYIPAKGSQEEGSQDATE